MYLNIAPRLATRLLLDVQHVQSGVTVHLSGCQWRPRLARDTWETESERLVDLSGERRPHQLPELPARPGSNDRCSKTRTIVQVVRQPY